MVIVVLALSLLLFWLDGPLQILWHPPDDGLIPSRMCESLFQRPSVCFLEHYLPWCAQLFSIAWVCWRVSRHHAVAYSHGEGNLRDALVSVSVASAVSHKQDSMFSVFTNNHRKITPDRIFLEMVNTNNPE